VPVHEQDGREFAAQHPGAFDRILVDAPCTGLGALRRRPAARWRKSPSDVAELVVLQTQLLDGAIAALAPGGIVAYVTCSPHLSETSGVISEVLRHRDDVAEPDAQAVMRDVAASPIDLASVPDREARHVQLWPHRH